jgi:hypothetical protein
LVHIKQKTKKEGVATIVAFFGVSQAKKKKKNDGNCCRLLWCVATKKLKKKVTIVAIAFFGVLQPKNKKRR